MDKESINNGMGNQSQYTFYAFISYQRKDEKWAKWLQDKLEHYRFPTNLNGRTDLPKYIRPIFRDITDLSPEPLEQAINNALLNSEWLIVVCSPRSAKSRWVCKEAQTFINIGREDHIIPFIIEGNPFSNDVITECYPEALLNLTGCKELRGANINEMGRDDAAISVIARMFGLKFETLRQRFKREEKKRRWIFCGFFLFFTIVLLALLWLGYNHMHNNAKEIAQKALFLDAKGDSYAARRLIQNDFKSYYPFVPEVETALRTIMSHNNTILNCGRSLTHINDIAYSSNGELLAVAGYNRIEMWNIKKGESQEVVLRNNDNRRISAISQVKFCPNSSINTIVTGHWDGNIVFWDIDTGRELYSLHNSNDKITSICFNRKGDLLFSTSTNDTLLIWNVNSRTPKKKIHVPDSSSCLKLNSDETQIAFANSKNLCILDLVSYELTTIPHGHNCHFINSLDYSSDNRFIITSSDNGESKLWDTNLLSCLDTFEGDFTTFSYQEERVLYLNKRKQIINRDFVTKSCVDSIPTSVNSPNIFQLSPTKKEVVIVNEANMSIRIVDVSFESSPKKLQGANNYTGYISISPINNYLLFEAKKGGVGLWNLITGDSVKTFPIKGVRSVSISPNGDSFALVHDSTIQVFDIKTANSRMTIKDSCEIDKIIYSTNGECLISGNTGSHENMKVWNLKNKETENSTFRILHSDLWHWYNPLIYHHSQESCVYVVSNFGDIISAWNYKKTNLPEDFGYNKNSGHKGHINDIAFSNDGRYMVSASNDMTVKLWDLKTKQLKETFSHSASVESVCFVPNSHLLVTSDLEGVIRVWDIFSETCIYSKTFAKNAIRLYYSMEKEMIIGISKDGFIIRCAYPSMEKIKENFNKWCS